MIVNFHFVYACVQEVDFKGLSNAQVILYLQEQERSRQMERYHRMQAKGQEIEKDHKFWNTQVKVRIFYNSNMLYLCNV